jgi:POT family proton-dependent oligopeptide transporter
MGHPKGLSTLFLTEFWERFSFYGMRGLLVLYASAAVADGGLGFSTEKATSIVGFYLFSVYFLGVPGGFLADKLFGPRLAVFIGGVIIACGHFTMVYPSVPTFYLGLVLVACGTGLLKPNVSSMVGSLYGKNDPRRDAGFSIFYMGINLGASVAPFVCGYLGQSEGFKKMLSSGGFNPLGSWHWGFGAAGVGMTLGLIQYVANRKRLAHVGMKSSEKKPREGEAPVSAPLTRDDWSRIGAIGVLFIFSVLFWAVYEQAATSFNLFADRLTNNTVFGHSFPSSYYQSLQAVFVIILAPAFAWLWVRLGRREPTSPAKFSFGLFFLGLSALFLVPASILTKGGRVSPLWLVGVYLLSVVGEMCLSPVGMSTYSKLAPAKLAGSIMGIWFMSIAVGELLAGFVAGTFNENSIPALVRLFGYSALVVLAGAAVLALLRPWVRKLMSGIQ